MKIVQFTIYFFGACDRIKPLTGEERGRDMEPKELLHEILLADNAAISAIDEATRRMENEGKDAEKLRADEQEKALADARAKIAAARSRARAQTEKEIEKLDKKCANNLRALEMSWAEEKSACTERIFRATVGLDD